MIGIKIMGVVVEEIIFVLAFCMILYEGISENIIQNVSCYQGEDEKSVFVYMNSNHEFFPNIEKNIEDSIKKEVETEISTSFSFLMLTDSCSCYDDRIIIIFLIRHAIHLLSLLI